jgi:hypothetical protein
MTKSLGENSSINERRMYYKYKREKDATAKMTETTRYEISRKQI